MDDDEDIFTLLVVITWYRYGSHDGNAISIQKITTKKKKKQTTDNGKTCFFLFFNPSPPIS